MAIPDFQSLMLPVLRESASDEVKIGDVIDRLADKFSLSEEERSLLLPSGRQTTFANRVHWAKSYLGKAGLIELTGRGSYRATESGRKVLEMPPVRIDIKYLERFPEFNHFRQATRPEQERPQREATTASAGITLTPDETMRAAQQQLESELGRDLLERILPAPPAFFERLVIRLLTATTSSFTESARETARTMSKRIVLIDGDELTRLMIRHGVGCRVEETLYVKKIDEEFFDE